MKVRKYFSQKKEIKERFLPKAFFFGRPFYAFTSLNLILLLVGLFEAGGLISNWPGIRPQLHFPLSPKSLLN